MAAVSAGFAFYGPWPGVVGRCSGGGVEGGEDLLIRGVSGGAGGFKRFHEVSGGFIWTISFN